MNVAIPTVPGWKRVFSAPMLLTLTAAAMAIPIFRADLWITDQNIVTATLDQIPHQNWLPRQLWSLSHVMKPEIIWAYQIWNVLALWLLGLVVYQVAEHFAQRTSRVNPAMANRTGLVAGLLVMCHPLAGTSACSISNLDWQLATLFSTVAAYFALVFASRPQVSVLVFGLISILLAALSSPSGLPLSVGSIFIIFHLAPEGERRRCMEWLLVQQRAAKAVILLGALQIMSLAWLLKSTWDTHSGQIGLSWSAHWLTQGRVFWMQIKSCFVPKGLMPDHTLAWSETWSDWPASLGLALLLLATVTLFVIVGRKHAGSHGPRWAAFLLLALLPTFLMLGWRTARAWSEVRWYAALPWGAIFVAWMLGWLISRWRAMSVPIGLGVPCFLAFTSIGETAKYQGTDELASIVMASEPHNLKVSNFIQEREAERGNLTAVMKASLPFEEAYRTMSIYNATNPHKRRYDLLNALRWWVEAERRVQMAVQKNYGMEYANAYAESSTSRFKDEVKQLAVTQPEALPLFDLLNTPKNTTPSQKPRTTDSIPGINSATASGSPGDN
jgi:hypothetical protein